MSGNLTTYLKISLQLSSRAEEPRAETAGIPWTIRIISASCRADSARAVAQEKEGGGNRKQGEGRIEEGGRRRGIDDGERSREQ